MKRNLTTGLLGALVLALGALAGCGGVAPTAIPAPTPTNPAATTDPPSFATPLEVPTVSSSTPVGPIVGTSVPGGGPIVSPPLTEIVPAATPDTGVVLTPGAGGSVTLTIADNGRRVEMPTGTTLRLDLSEGDYRWTVTLSNPAVLGGPVGTPLPAGPTQYTAATPGDTILSAEGLLPCHAQTPPCMAPTRYFQVSIRIR